MSSRTVIDNHLLQQVQLLGVPCPHTAYRSPFSDCDHGCVPGIFIFSGVFKFLTRLPVDVYVPVCIWVEGFKRACGDPQNIACHTDLAGTIFMPLVHMADGDSDASANITFYALPMTLALVIPVLSAEQNISTATSRM